MYQHPEVPEHRDCCWAANSRSARGSPPSLAALRARAGERRKLVGVDRVIGSEASTITWSLQRSSPAVRTRRPRRRRAAPGGAGMPPPGCGAGVASRARRPSGRAAEDRRHAEPLVEERHPDSLCTIPGRCERHAEAHLSC